MTSFARKPMDPPKRVCLRLKERREARGLTLAQVATRTRISQKYLEALEQCRFDAIPFGTVYQKNFIKRYAAAIGMPAEEFLQQFLEEEADVPKPQPASSEKQKKIWSSNMPMLIRNAVVVSVLVGAIAYLGAQVKQSIEPPTLTLYTPTDGFVTYAPEILVHGATEKEAQVSINNETIVLRDDGQFEEQIYLSLGVNTIQVSAKKKHGKTTIETRHVILKKSDELTRR